MIENLVVTDCSLYTVHQKYLKTNDDEMIINHMKIFFSHLMTAVNQRYMNSFENYTIFSLNTTVKAFLILKVIIKRFSNTRVDRHACKRVFTRHAVHACQWHCVYTRLHACKKKLFIFFKCQKIQIFCVFKTFETRFF